MRALTLMTLAVCLTTVPLAAQGVWRMDWGDNKAATVGESRARGISDIVRARGQAELDSAQAQVTREEARSRELDNRLKSTKTYFEMRDYNREQRFGTPEEKYAKKRANEEKYAKYARRGNPNELTAQQLDPLTGKISWPFALMPPQYKEYREQLDDLFEQRARHGGQISYRTYEQIHTTTDDFLTALREDIRDMNPSDYVAAKRFVNALAHQAEARG
ncbi:MAG: hypothetical protein GTO62_07765 [Planctomycetales bacterium]|nr:hypothetical protein [Planctomycetales bacterium]NIP69156.1 hypothetical protein [Planctomycetales bacterium]